MSKRNGTRPICLGAGFVALDVVRSEERVHSESRYAGGSCGNVMIILSFLGWKSSPVARIGLDRPGTQLLRDLERWSVDTRLLMREEAPTPVIFQRIFSDQTGHPQHRFSRQCFLCGRWADAYRPVRLRDTAEVAHEVPAPRVFYFDRVAPGNLELARTAKAEGALVFFEPSSAKDPRLFRECLNVSHVFKYSHERFDAQSELVKEAQVPLIIETRGDVGLRVSFSRSGRRVELPAVSAPRLRDAAGSGDWCTAGLISGFVAGDGYAGDLDDEDLVVSSLRHGQALAALNCAYEGARGAMYVMDKSALLERAAELAGGGVVALPEDVEPTPVPDSTDNGAECILCARPL